MEGFGGGPRVSGRGRGRGRGRITNSLNPPAVSQFVGSDSSTNSSNGFGSSSSASIEVTSQDVRVIVGTWCYHFHGVHVLESS